MVDKGGGRGKSCLPVSARGSLLLPLIDGGRETGIRFHLERKQGVSSALKKKIITDHLSSPGSCLTGVKTTSGEREWLPQ